MTELADVALGLTDKRLAEKKLRELVEQEQQRQAGIPIHQRLADSASRLLVDHLADCVSDLRKHCKPKSTRPGTVQNQVTRLISDCGWDRIADVTADRFVTWRAKQMLAVKTLNEYLGDAQRLLA